MEHIPEIKLSSILHLASPKDFKLHCAVISDSREQPLDIFVNDRERWHTWNSYKPATNAFNRKYIFSLCRFYHERDIWLFGGIYRVLGIETKKKYEIELTDIGQEFIGRLKLSLKLAGRNIRVNLENHYHEMLVSEILKESYSGQTFTGFENISLDFERLEFICRSQKQDWMASLQSIKGVYLITDKSNGKKYVGSAYNDEGIWSRWTSYVETGHGGNVDLRNLIKKKGLKHARKHFSFSLLEYRPARVDDQVIIDRETFWKKALLSRGDYGYNQN